MERSLNMSTCLIKNVEDSFISIVTVTWNRKNEVMTTLESIYAQNYKHFEVILIDNASTDDTQESVKKNYPDVRYYYMSENLGATGGRNVGIEKAEGNVIFFLDSDASLAPETLGAIVNKFNSDPSLGAVACKIVNAFTNDFDGAGWVWSELDKEDRDKEFLSFSFSEGGVAIRKDALKDVGSFWDFLFFGREGEELSLRLWDKGYKIIYCPDALVYHREVLGQITETRIRGGKREYYDFRNSLYIFATRYPSWLIWKLMPLRVGVAFVRSLKRRTFGFFMKAVQDFFKELPTLRKMRKPISHDTARLYVALMQEHGSLRWTLKEWIKHKF